MSPTKPPPLPQNQIISLSARRKILLATAILVVPLVFGLTFLRQANLLLFIIVPNGAMAPAIIPGDHILVEDLTFLMRPPVRGDIVIFKMDGTFGLPPGTVYVKRVAGLPGDHLRISEGNLFVNGEALALKNAFGEIAYGRVSRARYLVSSNDTTTVQPGHYFVLGDNSVNTSDSRVWGTVPLEHIMGRVLFCYWPLSDLGPVK